MPRTESTARSRRDLGAISTQAIVNSPLFKSAVAGNDPNVGRLVSAAGSYLGRASPGLDLSAAKISLGGRVIFEGGRCVPARTAILRTGDPGQQLPTHGLTRQHLPAR